MLGVACMSGFHGFSYQKNKNWDDIYFFVCFRTCMKLHGRTIVVEYIGANQLKWDMEKCDWRGWSTYSVMFSAQEHASGLSDFHRESVKLSETINLDKNQLIIMLHNN